MSGIPPRRDDLFAVVVGDAGQQQRAHGLLFTC